MILKLKILILFLLILFTSGVFAQRISETAFDLGANQTSSPEYWMHWNDSPAPAFRFVNVSKSWYNEDHRVSFRKGLGLNLQHANINLAGGGLGGGEQYTGSIYSLFISPELSAHVKIVPRLAVDLGPAFEYLVVGSNKLNDSWWLMYSGSGSSKISGINRDYFNQPSYGFKIRLLGIAASSKITGGLTFSYLWTKSESSNFFAKNYFRVSFSIGIRKSKGTTTELDEEPKDTEPNQ